MDVFIVGEDDACKAVIYKAIAFCAKSKSLAINIVSELPARGGEIKSLIKNFNKLSAETPVILLTDLDNNGCPPLFIKKLLDSDVKNDNFILSIAVDEVEAWLLADRDGFAKYFHIDVALIPNASQNNMQGRVAKKEIFCPYKTSLYMGKQLFPFSRNNTIRTQLIPREGATKGPEYNSVMNPFIKDYWDIEAAMKNSDSLSGMINRILRLIDPNIL